MKRWFGVIIIMSVLLSAISALADTANQDDKEKERYVISVIPKYLRGADIRTNTYSISQPYMVLGDEGVVSELYLVTVKGQCVGELFLSQTSEGDYFSGFSSENNETLDMWILKKQGLVFFTDGKTITVFSQKEKLLLNTCEPAEIVLTENYTSLQFPPNMKEYVIANMQNRDTGLQEYLSVGIVENGTINGAGQCWTASLAMVSNYRVGTHYDIHDAYDYLSSVALPGETVNSGEEKWYTRYFSGHYMSYTLCNPINGISLYNALHAGRPVIFNIKKTDEDGSHYHMIVLRSVELDDDGGALYSFADPNKTSGYIYVLVSNHFNPYLIYFDLGYDVYSSWVNTRY